MSFDLCVWYADQPVTQTQAADFCERFQSELVFLRRQPAFDAFFKEVLAKYPNLGGRGDELERSLEVPFSLLQTVDGKSEYKPPAGAFNLEPDERSPWSGTVSPHGYAAWFTIRLDHAEEVAPFVTKAAAKHGIAVYDPQSNKLLLPKLPSGPAKKTPLLVLEIGGSKPALTATLSLDGKVVAEKKVATRIAAHAIAREVGEKNALAFYRVVDPQTMAQAKAVPVALDDPSIPPSVKEWIAATPIPKGAKLSLARHPAGFYEATITKPDGTRATFMIAGLTRPE